MTTREGESLQTLQPGENFFHLVQTDVAAANVVPARGAAFLAKVLDYRAGKASESDLTEMFKDLVAR